MSPSELLLSHSLQNLFYIYLPYLIIEKEWGLVFWDQQVEFNTKQWKFVDLSYTDCNTNWGFYVCVLLLFNSSMTSKKKYTFNDKMTWNETSITYYSKYNLIITYSWVQLSMDYLSIDSLEDELSSKSCCELRYLL